MTERAETTSGAGKEEADVFLLAAGLGTRLRPLTDTVPKPLVRLGDKTLLERHLERIAASGFKEVIINLHHLGEQIKSFVQDGSRWGLRVSFSEEPLLLDTGGGIRNIEPLLKHQTLITINSDTVVGREFDLRELLHSHLLNPGKPLITMVLREDPNARSYGAIGINESGRVVAFLGEEFGLGRAVRELMFTGIQVLSSPVFAFMPQRGEVFSITRHTVRKILQAQGNIASVVYGGYWNDIGTPERLLEASKSLNAF